MLNNSYVVFIISFIMLSAIMYIFGIGQNVDIINDGKNLKTVNNYSWKYPLAISLLIWGLWHFYLYPPQDEITFKEQPVVNTNKMIGGLIQKKLADMHRINMVDWN